MALTTVQLLVQQFFTEAQQSNLQLASSRVLVVTFKKKGHCIYSARVQNAQGKEQSHCTNKTMIYCPFTEDLFLPFFALRRIKYLEENLQQEFTIHNSAITQICTEQCCCIRILPADLCNALRTLSVMHRARPEKGAGAQCTMHSVHGAAARCIRTGSALSTQR